MSKYSHRSNIATNSLNWLDDLSPLKFLAVVYVVRWLMLIVYLLITTPQLFSSRGLVTINIKSSPAVLFLLIIVVGPLFETLIECTIPYVLIGWISKKPLKLRPWGFIFISAILVVLAHPILPAIIPSFITGITLAYTYAHFAPDGHLKAIAYTSMMHAMINIVGWASLYL